MDLFDEIEIDLMRDRLLSRFRRGKLIRSILRLVLETALVLLTAYAFDIVWWKVFLIMVIGPIIVIISKSIIRE